MNEHTIRAALADGRIRGLLFDFDYTLGRASGGFWPAPGTPSRAWACPRRRSR